ncbi:MAG: hypothetical protein KAW12_11310 [Candidatus Aminicenantes bacterium]|nr:hypothetical protein [Candidatus Aminicenantes bacterium]
MKKKLAVAVCALIVLCVLTMGFFSLQTEAATCTSGSGDMCEGECCISNPFWCKAGPCHKILL